MKRALLYGIIAIPGLAAISYIGDYLVLRYRALAGKSPFGQVTVTTYYALHLKNGKIEYDSQPPHEETCSNSLYPHMGKQPCWYLTRHRERRIDI